MTSRPRPTWKRRYSFSQNVTVPALIISTPEIRQSHATPRPIVRPHTAPRSSGKSRFVLVLFVVLAGSIFGYWIATIDFGGNSVPCSSKGQQSLSSQIGEDRRKLDTMQQDLEDEAEVIQKLEFLASQQKGNWEAALAAKCPHEKAVQLTSDWTHGYTPDRSLCNIVSSLTEVLRLLDVDLGVAYQFYNETIQVFQTVYEKNLKRESKIQSKSRNSALSDAPLVHEITQKLGWWLGVSERPRDGSLPAQQAWDRLQAEKRCLESGMALLQSMTDFRLYIHAIAELTRAHRAVYDLLCGQGYSRLNASAKAQTHTRAASAYSTLEWTF